MAITPSCLGQLVATTPIKLDPWATPTQQSSERAARTAILYSWANGEYPIQVGKPVVAGTPTAGGNRIAADRGGECGGSSDNRE